MNARRIEVVVRFNVPHERVRREGGARLFRPLNAENRVKIEMSPTEWHSGKLISSAGSLAVDDPARVEEDLDVCTTQVGRT